MANIDLVQLPSPEILNAQDVTSLIQALKASPQNQFLFNQPKETQLADSLIADEIMSGKNLGSKDIAAWQNINKNRPSNISGNVDDKKSFLDNFATGYNENYTQGFQPSNLKNRNKTVSERLGEGIGTAMRFIDSPFGRGTLAGIAALGVGGNAGQALGYGLQAGVGRQNAITADKAYRDMLNKQGIDTSNIPGNITDEVAKNVALNNYRNKNLDVKLQLGVLKDNTSRARLINNMLTNGILKPEDALEPMIQYGIPIESLDTSNQTKMIPIRENYYKALINLGGSRVGIAQQNANTSSGVGASQINKNRAQTEQIKERTKQIKAESDLINDLTKPQGGTPKKYPNKRPNNKKNPDKNNPLELKNL